MLLCGLATSSVHYGAGKWDCTVIHRELGPLSFFLGEFHGFGLSRPSKALRHFIATLARGPIPDPEPEEEPQAWQPAPPVAERPSLVDEILKLADLHINGVLIDEDFAQAKRRLLE